MTLYENYVFKFEYLSYIEKSKFGKWTNKFTKDGFLIYEPYSIQEFERKLDLETVFNLKWGENKGE